MSIVVENLSKSYGSQKAVDNISFTASTGRITGFLGPNGAGKSTTMKTLTGILPIESGKCLINQKDIRLKGKVIKSEQGYLPENNPLYKHMYVREILANEARFHRLQNIKAKVENIIKETGLRTESHKVISQLSKGYKQRIGLALALIHNPQVLILDEPTSGLDPNQIIEIRKLIKKFGKEKTVLLSTHIMQEAESLCDEIIIIHKGKIKTHFAMDELNDMYPGKNLEEVFVLYTQ